MRLHEKWTCYDSRLSWQGASVYDHSRDINNLKTSLNDLENDVSDLEKHVFDDDDTVDTSGLPALPLALS